MSSWYRSDGTTWRSEFINAHLDYELAMFNTMHRLGFCYVAWVYDENNQCLWSAQELREQR